MEDLVGIGLRVTVMYGYALLIMRLAGKRSVAHLAPIDFLVGLVLGDMFDDVIWAEVPLAQGLVAFTTIVFLHSMVAFVTYRSQRAEAVICSAPTPVVRAGKLLEAGLQHERTPAREVEAGLRLCQVESIQEVQQANWEPSGELSVTRIEAAKPAHKKDLATLRQLV
jgi:uncharacterized membrane protein YcaP (DUF421 family)